MNQSSHQPQSILIVDDEPKNIQLLGNLLTEQSYEVEAAMSGEEALDWLNERRFDLILLDIMMPGINGYEACRKIKENPLTEAIPIIFLTAKTETEEIVHGFDVGAVDYVTKPFRTSELLSRVKTHLTIQRQRKELEELNISKDRFFSIIAHDLKNPFISLFDMIALLKHPSILGNPAELQNLLTLFQEIGDRTYSLLINLLEWAQLQRNVIKFKPQTFDIAKTVWVTAELFEEMAHKKNIKLRVDIPHDNIEISGDENMIATVFRNLISNAVKFTDSGGQIDISYRVLADNKLEFAVSDTGIGIRNQDIEKLFRIDKRLKVQGTAGELGTGLGLILCKEFIDRHDGEIFVESQEDKGSIFKIVFNK
jgi:signal transduction histidine kinase